MALSAPVLAPPRARELVSSNPPAPAAPSRRAQREQLSLARDASLDLFLLSYTGLLLYFTLPWMAEMILSRVPALFGIVKAPVAELQFQYGILVAILAVLSLALLIWAILAAPRRRWWHWPLFDGISVGVASGLLLHIWGANRLVTSACWGYLLPIPGC